MKWLILTGVIIAICGSLWLKGFLAGRKREKTKQREQDIKFKEEVIKHAKVSQREWDKIQSLSDKNLREEAKKSEFCKD